MSNTIYSPQVQGNVQAEVLCHSMLKQHSISKSRIGEFDVNDLLSNSHAVQAYSMPEVKNTQSSNDNFQYSVAQDGYPPWDWQSGGSYEAMSNQFEFGSVACHTQIIEPRQTSLELGRKNNPSAIALGGTQAYQQSRTIYDLHCHFAFSVDSTVASSSAKVSDTSSHTFSLPTVSATPDGPVTKHTSVFVEEPMPCPLAVGRSSSRDTQDQFLIMSKLSGMPYKEIKAQGQFREAESTLRGRFRSLTKSKAQRVRKPQWQERDVSWPQPFC